VLATGLAKEPARRYQSALELARALQRLEAEMGATVTPVDISAEDPVAAKAEIAPENDGRTRIRPLTTIHAQQPTTAAAGPARDRTQLRGTRDPALPAGPAAGNQEFDQQTSGQHTQLRSALVTPKYLQAPYLSPQAPPDTQVRPVPDLPSAVLPQSRKSRVGMFVGAGVAIVLLGGVGTVLVVRGTAAAPPPVPRPTSPPQSAFVATTLTPSPSALLGRVFGKKVVFTWKNPDPQPGDYFEWQRTDAPPGAQWDRLVATTVTIAGTSKVCVDVNLIRQNGSSSTSPASACAGKA
jgi:hypothetical protein